MKQYRVVQVGCGGMAHHWIDMAGNTPDLEIVGLVDLNRQTAEECAKRHGLPASVVFDTLDQALSMAKPDIVFDVTVPAAHHEVTLAALKAGCHVFGEKPLADSMERAKEMVAAAKASGKLYAVMQNRRYLPQMRGLRKALDDRLIGDISTVNADFYLGAHFGGFRDAMDSPLVLDMAIHTFDQARFICGEDPIAVYCHEYNPKGSWYKGHASAVCMFEMTNDVVFTYRGSWCAEGLNTSWESEWRVQGSKGSSKWNGANEIIAEVVSAPDGFIYKHDRITIQPLDTRLVGHDGCMDAMMTALREGKEPETVCTDNIKSLAMVFGATESAKTKQRVEIGA
ncbi:MAG: Gfo/Idh/MocA family oxidoreductase [Armatimonadota bacterium]|nr:Gfo/Idh/MocA family oxidoreductase [Armatimonadota bacterium]